MRPFILVRIADDSGVSGTGTVAEGCEWADGTVAMRWLTRTASTAVYDSIAHVEHIHGHGGKTRVLFIPLTPPPHP